MIKTLRKIFDVFSKTEKLVFFAAAILAAASSTGLAASLIKEKTTVVPASGGSYVEGMVGQPSYPNPVLASSETDKSLVRLLFSNLADLSSKLTPDKTNQNWDVRLKENVFWSDGEKLTSDDVIFTIQKIQDPDSNSPLAQSWRGVSVQRVSELEVRFQLGGPYALFPENLKNLYILPKHLYAETPVSNWRISRYNLQPVSAGPYAFDSYENRPDGFITAYRLKPNGNYFGRKPMISSFNFAFFPNSEDLVKAFNGGQIDGFADTDPNDVSNIKRTYEEYDFSLPSYYAVFFDQSQSIVLEDPAVLQALDISVDRGDLIRNALSGKGVPAYGPVPPSLIPGQEQPNYSLETAAGLLDSAGWKMSSSTVRQKTVKKSRLNLELTLTVPDVPFLINTANQLKSQWEKLGVKTDISILSPDDISNGAIKNRNYQALLFGNVLNPAEDLFAFWHSSQRFYPGLNLSLYNNSQADRLIEGIRQEESDSARLNALQNLQNTIVNSHSAVFLYSPYYLYLARKDLHGLEAGLIGQPADRLDNVSEWYLKTARVLK